MMNGVNGFVLYPVVLGFLIVQLRSVVCQNIDQLNRANLVDYSFGSRDKCEIEISTRGSCVVNNNRLKPRIVLHFKTKHSVPPSPVKGSDIDKIDRFPLNGEDAVLRQKIVNEFVREFLKLLKQEYGNHLEPLSIKEVQFVKLKHWGNANIYDLNIYGLKNIVSVDSKLTIGNSSLDSSQWKFNVTLRVSNLTVDFKVDANIKDKIFIKNWKLLLLIENCQLKSSFVIDFERQNLLITSVHINSFDNFKLVSETLSWPFNEIVANIVTHEKYYIRHIIELNAQKYINLTLNRNFDLNHIMDKVFGQKLLA